MSLASVSQSVNWSEILQQAPVQRLVRLALAEDIGTGDLTTQALFTQSPRVVAHILTREAGVVCGLPLVQHLLTQADPETVYTWIAPEGSALPAGAKLLTCQTSLTTLLTLERVLLNFLMRLTGIATATAAAVQQLPAGSQARIYDTRKTIPGWRLLDKAAVRTGGGCNHRLGLFAALLIKDNHLVACGSLTKALERARALVGTTKIVEVEVDNFTQLTEALRANPGPDIILLDNFSCRELAEAVALRQQLSAMHPALSQLKFEASGGIKLQDIREVALTGVEMISLGALTHSVKPLDLTLEIVDGGA